MWGHSVGDLVSDAPKESKIAGVSVTVSEPDDAPLGVTFLLPGAMVQLSEYDSTRDVLLERRQIVIGFFLDVLSFESHDEMAEKVPRIFKEFLHSYPNLPNSYNVVGHSVGAKLSLLLPAKVDPGSVSTVIALDPVDEHPPEFTNDSGNGENLSLLDTAASIYVTWAKAGGRGISKNHNAKAIYDANSEGITFIEHEDAGHMAYTDHGGGLAGVLMRGGTAEGNKNARIAAHDLIRKHI